MIVRLKEIQTRLTTEKIALQESMLLLEEAVTLKKKIDAELAVFENTLTQITASIDTRVS